MSKVYGKDSTPSNKPNRNTVDLSFSNNLTLGIGGLYPVMMKEVLPGDSVRLNTTFGLRFMPLYFPIQTKMRAYIHYFYVRSRNLWNGWENFISNTSKPTDLPRPYLAYTKQQQSDMLATSKIGDYLGIPTAVYGSYGKSVRFSGDFFCNGSSTVDSEKLGYLTRTSVKRPYTSPYNYGFSYSDLICPVNPASTGGGYPFLPFLPSGISISDLSDAPALSLPSDSTEFTFSVKNYTASLMTGTKLSFYLVLRVLRSTDSAQIILIRASSSNYAIPDGTLSSFSYSTRINHSFIFDNTNLTYYPDSNVFSYIDSTGSLTWNAELVGYALAMSDQPTNGNFLVNLTSGSASVSYNSDDIGTLADADPNLLIFKGSNSLNAEPFRAYESIYNAFYRDERNNPYLIDGQPEYQKFLPTLDGGSDSNIYPLRYRNWEQDQFTTALPTPQQGTAPLVGISDNGIATYIDPDTEQPVRVQFVPGTDNGDGTASVEQINYIDPISAKVARSVLNSVTSGISINDFRNVNSYQRWLETNIRKGYKYKDQIKGHYGVDVSYAVLDMPEFLGGASQVVEVNQINQTSQQGEDSPLGSYAGQAYAVGSSNNSVSRYFDEHGYLVGILSVVPVPSYSQVIPKMFFKRDLLDIYFPEFGKIGYQPILNRELAPLQTYLSNPEDMTKVFGYQRPWYDYLSSLDEVHGEFRTTLRDFLVNRTFDSKPTLGPDFTVINPSHLNDIFSVTTTDDKILGQIHFNMQMRRPIPLSGVPSLE